ncbi:hypothetical protein C8R43DRAFT_869126 [Mycena crocata]|nr:hypothetical protein C8R43DRAFT_869126 [Mycena crocata]
MIPNISPYKGRPSPVNRQDPDDVRRYKAGLEGLREKAIKKPLASGQEYDLRLTLPTQNSDPSSRRVPPIQGAEPCASVTVKVRLVEALQTGVGKFSQVWTARIIPTPESPAHETLLVLKIIQPSMCKYPTGDESWITGYNEVPEDLAQHEAWSYRHLADQQGSSVPYFFGLSEILTASEEKASVLVLEHIPGPTLDDVAKLNNLDEKQLKNIVNSFLPLYAILCS